MIRTIYMCTHLFENYAFLSFDHQLVNSNRLDHYISSYCICNFWYIMIQEARGDCQ